MYKFYSIGNIFSSVLSITIFIAFFSFSVTMLINLVKERARVKQNIIEYSVTTLFIIISSILLFTAIQGIAFQIIDYVVPYKNGDYKIVSGEVVDLVKEEKQRYVSFSVDGVDFEFYPKNILHLGIKNPDYLEDNDNVVIKYVIGDDILGGSDTKINVVMEIEIKQETVPSVDETRGK
ncbi:MAG: hypothetical protein ACI4XC_07365 [Eubacterium sp.]